MLRRAFAVLVLLVLLTIIEEVVVGLFHHQSIAASLGDLFGARLLETLAGYLIMLLVLISFFAFRVLSEALGEGRLERMFFVERGIRAAQVTCGDGCRAKLVLECFERQLPTRRGHSLSIQGMAEVDPLGHSASHSERLFLPKGDIRGGTQSGIILKHGDTSPRVCA